MNILDAKPLRDLTLSDLQVLVEAEVREGRDIDYKQRLPGETEAEKKEFLADASSFANASGGHLVYGVRERRDAANDPMAVPESFPGVEAENDDVAIQRLDNILRSGTDPRIPGVEIRAVRTSDGKPIIILRIPRSWTGPHMIAYQEWCRFYSRNSSGKCRLDVAELRGLFLRSESVSRYVREFQAGRLGSLLANETPLPLPECPLAVLHLVPLTAADPAGTFDLRGIATQPRLLPPIRGGGWNDRLNFDGFVTFTGDDQHQPSLAYTQVFRNGSIEAVAGIPSDPKERKIAPWYEGRVASALAQYLRAQALIGVGPPLAVSVSMLRVRGCTMASGPHYSVPLHGGADRDVLAGPFGLIEDMDSDAAQVLRPSFDALWNAFGYPGSINYDNHGNWRPRSG